MGNSDTSFSHLSQFATPNSGEKVGFTELEHKVSSDGANIAVFFQKSAAMTYPINDKGLNIPGNAERIINIVNNHTAYKHYLTTEPYRRFFCRMGRMISEKCATANFASGKKLLDRLYA